MLLIKNMKITVLVIGVILLTASTAFSVCQVWSLSHQYRSPGSMNNTCVYKASFQEVTVEANGQYCPSYILYNPSTKELCN